MTESQNKRHPDLLGSWDALRGQLKSGLSLEPIEYAQFNPVFCGGETCGRGISCLI